MIVRIVGRNMREPKNITIHIYICLYTTWLVCIRFGRHSYTSPHVAITAHDHERPVSENGCMRYRICVEHLMSDVAIRIVYTLTERVDVYTYTI